MGGKDYILIKFGSMPCRFLDVFLFLTLFFPATAQFPLAPDTITVIENGRVLRMPWAGGLNYCTVSGADMNFDGRQDLVLFDRQNTYGIGRFRVFINTGKQGRDMYRYEPGYSYLFPEVVYWAIMRDYDNDGRADLFCSTNGGIKVYRNVSNPQNIFKLELVSPLLHSNYYPQSPPPIIVNLYAGTAGVPGIADVDNDGDLDVLTYTPLGVYLEMHRNMSMELYGHSDSLVFQREDDCWGDLSENNCQVDFEICTQRLKETKKELHAGSCIACFDSDGDSDMDLILGDMTCNSVNYVHNTGSAMLADFSDSTKLYPNFPQKNTDGTHIRISHFPCAYIVDGDGDGREDLFASPNAVGSDNVNSLWFYKNTSATSTVNFVFQKKNFLQDEMIDVGLAAFPVLFDYDADGKKDLLIGTHGYFTNGLFSSRLRLYKNTGTSTVPQFSLVSDDYLQLSAEALNNVMPAVGDPDNDGDTDILIGTSTGQIHWLENIAGPGNPASFTSLKFNPFKFTTTSAAAAPQLFDLDKDGRQDLLIGMKNGRIAYYLNTGSGSSVSFSLVTNSLGGIHVKAEPTKYGLDAFATPFFYEENNQLFVLVGNVTGDIAWFRLDDTNVNAVLLESRINGLTEASQTVPWYEDINNDGKRDLFIGQASGGISFFSSSSPYVSVEEKEAETGVRVFPNPVNQQLFVVQVSGLQMNRMRLYSIDGRVVFESGSASVIEMSHLLPGVYTLEMQYTWEGSKGVLTRKVVKQ